MANILSLAMKISADASGVVKNLTPAERALENLGKQAEKLTSVFDQFANDSAAAGAAQANTKAAIDALTASLQAGTLAPAQFAEEYAKLGAAVEKEAAAFQRAREITQANLSPLQRYDQATAELTEQLNAGRISQETYDRALAKATDAFTKAERAANGYDKAVESAGNNGLKFNELSGVLSALPGPLGNIAGRFSGLASAGEGLSRIFSTGLKPGLASIGTSVAGLVTPFTAAVAGVAAFGAAATSVTRGLLDLEDRVEKLGNTADKLGVSFEFIQTLEEAANRSGTSIDAVSSAFGRLQKSVLGVDEESKAAQKALAEIGVTSQQLADLNPEEQYRLIGDSLRTIEDPAKRTATAIALFGKAGADLIPFFNNISGAAVDVERFNATLSSVDRTRIDGLGASFDAVAVSLRGFGQELLTPFIGVTQSISDGLASTFASVGRGIGALLDAISPLTSALGLVVNVVLQGTSVLTNFIGTALEPAAAVGRILSGVIDSISQVVTAVAGRVNDAVIAFREFFKFEGVAAGFSAAFSAIGDAFAKVGDTIGRVATIVGTSLSRLASVIFDTVGVVTERVGGIVSAFLEFTGIGQAVSGVASAIGTAFGSAWELVKGVASTIGGLIDRVLTFAENWLGIKTDVEEPVVTTVEFDGGGAIEELTAESKDFQKTIDGITASVNTAIEESAQFGQAGFDAALKYQESINKLKEQLDAGLFNEETFRREAEKAGVAFKDELARIEQDAQLEIRIKEDAEKTLAGINEAIGKAVNEAVKFGDAGEAAAIQFQDNLNELKRQFEAGIINETALAQGVEAANAAYKGQIDSVKQLQEEQRKLIEDDQKRIDGLLAQNDAASKLEQDLLAVQREQARVSEQLAAARADGVQADADAAAARQAELDQLQAKLEEQQQALEQGFGQGFEAAFANVDNTINGLIEKSTEFGQAGFDAAQRLQEGIAEAQQQARDGILNQEAFERQVQQQQELFNQEIENIKEAEKQREQGIKDRAAFEKQQADEIAKAQQQQAAEQQKAQEAVYKAQEQAAKQAEDERRKFLEEQQKAYEAEVKRQEERISALNTLGSVQVNTADIRTSQGAALVLNLAAEAQDPALIQARLQTKLLQQIALGIGSAASNYLNAPVSIVGYSQLGGVP